MESEQVYKQIAYYLGAAGIIFPTTAKQVEAFERGMAKEKAEVFIFPSPEQILVGEYHTLKRGDVVKMPEASSAAEDFVRAAARNGKEIPKEIMEKMRKDRNEKEGEK